MERKTLLISLDHLPDGQVEVGEALTTLFSGKAEVVEQKVEAASARWTAGRIDVSQARRTPLLWGAAKQKVMTGDASRGSRKHAVAEESVPTDPDFHHPRADGPDHRIRRVHCPGFVRTWGPLVLGLSGDRCYVGTARAVRLRRR